MDIKVCVTEPMTLLSGKCNDPADLLALIASIELDAISSGEELITRGLFSSLVEFSRFCDTCGHVYEAGQESKSMADIHHSILLKASRSMTGGASLQKLVQSTDSRQQSSPCGQGMTSPQNPWHCNAQWKITWLDSIFSSRLQAHAQEFCGLLRPCKSSLSTATAPVVRWLSCEWQYYLLYFTLVSPSESQAHYTCHAQLHAREI